MKEFSPHDFVANKGPLPFALSDHLFVIRALILRDLRLRNQHRGRLGFLNDLIQPLVVIVLHYYVFIFINRFMPARIPVELYVLGGFTTWFTFRDTSAKNILAIENERGFILIPRIQLAHVLAATAVWETALSIAILYVGLFSSMVLLGSDPLPNVPLSIAAFCIAALLGTGFKLVFDSLGERWPVIKGTKGAVTFLLFLTSGIYFGSTGSPSNQDILNRVVSFNPLFDLLEPQRHALWPGYPVAGISMLYPLTWALGLMFVGLLLRGWVRSRTP